MDKRIKPDRGPADMLRTFPFRAVLNIEKVAPTDGFFGDPSVVSHKLGDRVVEKTADKIAADVRRFLEAFPVRKRREL